MITTYVFTFNSRQEFDEFMVIVNDINRGLYVGKDATPILSIEALMYDGSKNNYMCLFNTDGKLLNTNILKLGFDLIAYSNHPDKNKIYKTLNKKSSATDIYCLFDNYDDMTCHYGKICSFFCYPAQNNKNQQIAS